MAFKGQTKELNWLVAQAKRIAERLNLNIYLVGGPLRDILLKKEVKDIDLMVDSPIGPFVKEFAQTLKGKVLHYPQFLTARIEYENKNHSLSIIDIAQTRKEVYERPANLPKVSPATIEEDLRRRDFTINAIAYDLRREEVFDPLGGKRDLEKGVIRVLHKKSFIDDPTRILRAVRFAQRFNFSIEKNTLRLIKEALERGYLSLLSGERFLQELRLIAQETNWFLMVKEMQRWKVFNSYFGKDLPPSAIKKLQIFAQKRKPLPLFFLLSHFPTACLPLRREEKKEIESFQRSSLLTRLKRIKRPSTVYRLLQNFTPTSLTVLKELIEPERRRKIEDYLNSYPKVKINLTGKDLKRLGIKPEVRYGEFLRKILYRTIDGQIKTKEEELAYLQKLVFGKQRRKRG